MPGIGLAPGGAVVMEDVGDLEPRATHRRRASLRVSASPRSMMRAGRGGWLPPGSLYWRRGCTAPWCRVWHGPEVSESREYRHPLEEVGGETVPQRVGRHALLDPRGLAGGTDGAAELADRQR